ncbi:hypothetical protein [Sphingobacterium hungaricum]
MGAHTDQKGNDRNPEARIDTAEALMALVDSITKLPFDKFNEDGLLHIQKLFEDQFPIEIFNKNDNSISDPFVISSSKADDQMLADISIYLNEPYSNATRIADFSNYFGPIEEKHRLSRAMKVPLPETIEIDNRTSLQIRHLDRLGEDEKLVFQIVISKEK